MQDETGFACATGGGLAGRLSPEVAAGLGAISRVSRALTGTGDLPELAKGALAEMRSALGLEAAVLYLPDAGGRPVLRRFLDSGELETRPELVFDEEGWRLAVTGGHPLVFGEPASWLVENPFKPEATHWLALPMNEADRLVGVVMAARAVPVELDPTSATVLRLLGDQLSAGITTARLRQQLQQAELERERMRLAAEVHDGLAQDLALAMREIALLDSGPERDEAEASRERLREAVAHAHRLVRARLVDLSAAAPLGGLRAALEDLCDRFARRGLPVRLEAAEAGLELAPETTALVLRVVNEALTNADKHAAASHVEVRVARLDGGVELSVRDDGGGFEPANVPGPAGGHLGLSVMQSRAADAGGTIELTSAPGGGTSVLLRLPV